MLTKFCKRCSSTKDLSLFPKNSKGKFGRGQTCNSCSAKITASARDPVREACKKYSLSVEEVLSLRKRTVCEICGGVQKKIKLLCIDHNHITGRVRGVLCDDCNLGIGKLRDSPALLQKALAYLERYEK